MFRNGKAIDQETAAIDDIARAFIRVSATRNW